MFCTTEICHSRGTHEQPVDQPFVEHEDDDDDDDYYWMLARKAEVDFAVKVVVHIPLTQMLVHLVKRLNWMSTQLWLEKTTCT